MGLIFHPGAHVYELDGVRVPSVTGILKASGLIDFSSIPIFILAQAMDRGTKVHQAIHFWNEHDLDVHRFEREFPEHYPYLEAWLLFCSLRHFVPVLCEHRVASRRHQVAGTIDCVGILDGVACIVDFATGDPAAACKQLQTAGYLGLALEWAGETDEDPALENFLAQHPVIRRFAVALRGDGSFRLEQYDDPRDFRKFLVLVEAQRIVAAFRKTEVAA